MGRTPYFYLKSLLLKKFATEISAVLSPSWFPDFGK
jgi:hypothetical protein